MASLPKLSGTRKREIEQLLERATRALGAGRAGACEQVCEMIENIQPGNADVANLRAFTCVQNGDWENARQYLEQAIKADPNRSEFHHNLAKLYLRHELYAEAAKHFHNALACTPDSLEIRLGYCSCLVDMGNGGEALPLLEQMREKLPQHPAVLIFLAKSLNQLKRYEEARGYLDALIAQDGRYVDARFEKAVLLMKQGLMDEAEAEFREIISLNPADIKAYANIAGMKKCTSGDIQAMEELYAKTGEDDRDRIPLCFALAEAYENIEQFDKAFGFYDEGNRLRHKYSRYNLDAELDHLKAVMSFYTPEVVQRTSKLEDDRPIFIVGMPRCGSTLTEQILAAHPEVFSQGESNSLEMYFHESRATDQPLTLEELTAFSSDQWREVGLAYMEKAGQGSASKVVDKTLDNFRLIGAIHCALPGARIVHVRRNPLDNCLAIYRANFINDRLDYGTSLEQLGHYYRMYQQVMQHWRDVLPEGVMYELDYEQLVTDQEGETRKLLDACGLQWDDACLQFSKAPTYVETASMAQVRRPMYSEAVGRWKHYEKHLQPLIDILGTD